MRHDRDESGIATQAAFKGSGRTNRSESRQQPGEKRNRDGQRDPILTPPRADSKRVRHQDARAQQTNVPNQHRCQPRASSIPNKHDAAASSIWDDAR